MLAYRNPSNEDSDSIFNYTLKLDAYLKSNFSIKKQQGKIEEIIEIESWIGKRKEIIADV